MELRFKSELRKLANKPRVIQYLRRQLKPIYLRWERIATKRILKRTSKPESIDSEATFQTLSESFRPPPEYGYDSESKLKRATERRAQLISLPLIWTRPLKILEVGCGDGMCGVLLSRDGHEVTLLDGDDWRDTDSRLLPFIQADCSRPLSLAPEYFDLIYSYNTFEHLHSPDAAIKNLLRVLHTGGLVHLNFGPLYSSAWGLHAYRSLNMPYPQFLFSEEFLKRKLAEIGIWDLGRRLSALQPLNRWTVRQYEKLWSDAQCKILSQKYECDPSFLSLVRKYPEAFQGRDLSIEDLITEAIVVTLAKTQQTQC